MNPREGWEPRRREYWLVPAKDRRNCPECDQFALVETLDPPTCQVCGCKAESPTVRRPLRAIKRWTSEPDRP